MCVCFFREDVIVVPEKLTVFIKREAVGKKIKRTDNAQKRIVEAHGDRNNWRHNGKETVPLHVY